MDPQLVQLMQNMAATAAAGLVVLAIVHNVLKRRAGERAALFKRLSVETNGIVDLSGSWPVLTVDNKGRKISLYYEVTTTDRVAQAFTRVSTSLPSPKIHFYCYSRKGMPMPSHSSQLPTGDTEFDDLFVIWVYSKIDQHSSAAIHSIFTEPLRKAFIEFHHICGQYSSLRVNEGKITLSKRNKLTDYALLRRCLEGGVKVFDCLNPA